MWHNKLLRTFSKIYRRYCGLVSRFQVGLGSLLCRGLSGPGFYGDLVYKLRKIVGSGSFSARFLSIVEQKSTRMLWSHDQDSDHAHIW